MYYSRPPAGLLVWRGCLVSSLPPHLFSLHPPPAAPLQLFYGLIFGRRPEAAPWGPPLPPACPSPSLRRSFSPRSPLRPGALHILRPGTARLPSISEILRPAQGGSCPRVPGPQLGPRAGLPTLGHGTGSAPDPPAPAHLGSPWEALEAGSPSPLAFLGPGGLEGGGGERTGIKSQVLACPELLGKCRKGKRSPGLTSFLASSRLENLLSAERPPLAENPRDSPSQARATPPLFLSPLWLPLKLCGG